jgi:hypothetical protein
MVAVLAGLAENTGLKEFSFQTQLAETNATLAMLGPICFKEIHPLQLWTCGNAGLK